MSKYYQASGKVSPISIILLIVLSLTVFPIVGFLYSLAIWYIPFIYVNAIIAAGMGAVVGFSVNLAVLKVGKVRNKFFGLAFGVLGGLIALYLHWAIWISLVVNASEGGGILGVNFSLVTSLLIDPVALLGIIKVVNETGTWGMSDAAVTGVPLATVWLIELGIFVVIPVLMCKKQATLPFCELDDKWFDEKVLPPVEFIADKRKMVADLEASNPAAFEGLGLPTQAAHSVFYLFTSGHGTSYLTIENMIPKVDNDGKVSFDETTVIEAIALNGEMRAALKSL